MKIASTSTLGFPRMGPNRELKFALEKYWKGVSTQDDLVKAAQALEEKAWELQMSHSIDRITVGDHYLYDGVLTWTEYLGIIPKRFHHLSPGMDRMFAMARGVDGSTALSMKKWITSNYHFQVPEYEDVMQPDFTEFKASVARGIGKLGKSCATPVVLGPVTMTHLTKFAAFAPGFEKEQRRAFLERLIPVYSGLLQDLASMGVAEVQIHEAALVWDDDNLLPLFKTAYPSILPAKTATAFNMVSSMEDIGSSNYQWLISVPEISIISLDLTRGDNLGFIEEFGFPADKILGGGLIDSRSVWRFNPDTVTSTLKRLATHVSQLRIQPSGSLQYVPWDLACEKELLEHPAGPVLSFALQKLEEIVDISRVEGNTSALAGYKQAWKQYKSAVESDSSVTFRVQGLTEKDFCRAEPFEIRKTKQLQGMPFLPTTTIGSFPQTKAIRNLRAQHKKGALSDEAYEAAIDKQIAVAIGIQEALGLDILVHGEAERTDMVEFFGQKIEGMLFSSNGWVQSFGSRCVRPPIIWADVSRPKAMTVREFVVAQELTDKPVKGMLTGPVTILNWSFPRIDVSRQEQAMQIALCIRDEIQDLENAGCVVVQVDEPALREAMPLRRLEKEEYLNWAVDAFRLSTAQAASETQIHTHMCYCEFQDCMGAIDRLDTDVNSIENARNDNATLLAFKNIGYSKALGPGTYDIHSPVVPTVEFIAEKLESFLECMDVSQIVVNPDCGLKTRTWPETIAALKNMVTATEMVRQRIAAANN